MKAQSHLVTFGQGFLIGGRENPLESPTGWWFGTCFIFHHIMGCHPSYGRTHIFQRGRVETTNQPWFFFWSWPVMAAMVFLSSAGPRKLPFGGHIPNTQENTPAWRMVHYWAYHMKMGFLVWFDVFCPNPSLLSVHFL